MLTDADQLIVRRDSSVVQTVSLTMSLLTIGRLPDNGLALADQEVSRRHAEVRREASGFTITDLGSANGTLIGGERIPPNQPHVLAGGVEIQIGPFTLQYRAAQPTVEETIPPEAPSIMDQTMAEVEPPPAVSEAAAPVVEAAPPEASAAEEVAVEPAEEAPIEEEAPVEIEQLPPEPPALPPLPPAPPPSPPRPTYLMPLAQGPISRYVRSMPSIYQDSGFLGRFLLIMESLWEPIERRQDHIDMYFDPRTCPPRFVFWLASWLDLSLNENWPEDRCRRLLAEAMDLYRWRGTRYGLVRILEVCTGITPEVIDLSTSSDGAEARPYVFQVRVRIPPGSDVDRELIETLVRTHKPAHAGYVLEVTS